MTLPQNFIILVVCKLTKNKNIYIPAAGPGSESRPLCKFTNVCTPRSESRVMCDEPPMRTMQSSRKVRVMWWEKEEQIVGLLRISNMEGVLVTHLCVSRKLHFMRLVGLTETIPLENSNFSWSQYLRRKFMFAPSRRTFGMIIIVHNLYTMGLHLSAESEIMMIRWWWSFERLLLTYSLAQVTKWEL